MKLDVESNNFNFKGKMTAKRAYQIIAALSGGFLLWVFGTALMIYLEHRQPQ